MYYWYFSSDSISDISVFLFLFILVIFIAWKEELHLRFSQIPRRNIGKQIDSDIESSQLNISDNVVRKILKNLEEFERSEKFLSKNIKKQALAIRLKTNDKYLSKTIKHYYSKKFVDYVNDLRIDYTINKLKNDRRFRLYSIRSIADEVGFSNPITFSKAFEKRQGSKPSHFIKCLNDSDN